jgi:hypothetical protein
MSQANYNAAPAEIVPLTPADGQVVTGSCVLYGAVVSDEAAGSLQVHLHNGTDNTGVHVAAASVSANGSTNIWFGPNGIHCPDGIYNDVVTGTATGSVFITR